MFLILIVLGTFFQPVNAPLYLEIQGIKESRGAIQVAVFRKEAGFLDPDKAWFKAVYPVREKGSMRIPVPDWVDGHYAVSCFHDVNGNQELDKNLLGIPIEPYGFSNNARPKFRAPNWGEARVYVNDAEKPLTVRLETW